MNKVQHIFGAEIGEEFQNPLTMISEISEQFLRGNPFYLVDFGKVQVSFTPKKNIDLLRNPFTDPMYDSEQIVVVGSESTKIISRIDALRLILENTSLENDMEL